MGGEEEESKDLEAQNESKDQENNNEDDIQHTSVGDHGRQGLSSEEAEKLYQEVGFNELEHIEISPIKLFFLQFTGLMPYILEIACVLALAVEDYIDFAIIFIILLSNGTLGYTEEMKAKKSLVRSIQLKMFEINNIACH